MFRCPDDDLSLAIEITDEFPAATTRRHQLEAAPPVAELFVGGPSTRVGLLTQQRIRDSCSSFKRIGGLGRQEHLEEQTIVVFGGPAAGAATNEIRIDRGGGDTLLFQWDGVVGPEEQQNPPRCVGPGGLHPVKHLADRIGEREVSTGLHEQAGVLRLSLRVLDRRGECRVKLWKLPKQAVVGSSPIARSKETQS